MVLINTGVLFLCFFSLLIGWFGSEARRRSCLLLGGLLGRGLLLRLLRLLARDLGALGDQHGVDVGEDTALGDGHAAEQLVQLLVVADGQLDVAGDDARLLVVAGGVAGQLGERETYEGGPRV